MHILTTTKRCNLKCVYCHSAVASKIANEKEYDMDKKTAKKTLEFIFQTPEKGITIEFQGGETLLREDLFKYVVKEAKKINKKHNKGSAISFCSEGEKGLLADIQQLLKKEIKFLHINKDEYTETISTLGDEDKLNDQYGDRIKDEKSSATIT